MVGRKSKIVTTALLVGVLLTGCATIKVGHHQDESVSLDFYQSFSWITDDPLILGAGDGAKISPLAKKKIVDSIAATIRDKGYTYTADRSKADFIVSYTIGTREKIDASSYPHDYTGEWSWHLHGRGYYSTEVVHRYYTEGTLGIDIFDGKTKEPVWHGWASKTISSSDRADPSPAIKKAVEGVLALFPSRAE